MNIGILAVQGAFAEQEDILKKLGVPYTEIRCADDADQPFDGVILPGGESTVQGKLVEELGIFASLKQRISQGMPGLGTCAGMILLAQYIENQRKTYFGTMPITVRRNAYGRQLGSFHTEAFFQGIGRIPMTFIRAPFVSQANDAVQVLATVDDRIVAVRYQNQFALAFHPELDDEVQIHQLFLQCC